MSILSQKGVFSLIKTLVGTNDVIAVNMSLVRFAGTGTAGLILCQLLYWTDKAKIAGGWVCKSYDEWEEELMLSRDKVKPAVAHLKKIEAIETKLKKFNGAPTIHYRIKEKEFTEKFMDFVECGKTRISENPIIGKPTIPIAENPQMESRETRDSIVGKSDILITETTTETTSLTTTETNSNGAAAPASFSGSILDWDQSYLNLPAQPEEEKEKGSAQKEKEEVSGRRRESQYQDVWWEFYKAQNKGEEPPHSWRNHYTIGGPLEKIQHDLVAMCGNEEEAYQEFVSILSGWQHPKNYHQDRLRPAQIHKHLVEIRRIIRGSEPKVTADVPCVNEALELYRQAHLEHKDLPASIDEARDLPLLQKTLAYLKSTVPGQDWREP